MNGVAGFMDLAGQERSAPVWNRRTEKGNQPENCNRKGLRRQMQ
jgi:hypothetical protein